MSESSDKTSKAAKTRKSASKKGAPEKIEAPAAAKKGATAKTPARQTAPRKPEAKSTAAKPSTAAAPAKQASKAKTPGAVHHITEEKRQRMISEAAYHIAAKRQFAPGDEMEDWLQAEAQIDAGLKQTDNRAQVAGGARPPGRLSRSCLNLPGPRGAPTPRSPGLQRPKAAPGQAAAWASA